MSRGAARWGVASVLAVLSVGLAAPGGAQGVEEAGRQLVQDLGCPICHDVPGHESTVGQEAPELTFEGDRVHREWLFEFLQGPHVIRPAIRARMPTFRLNDAEALALTEYLATLRDSTAAALPEAQRYKGPPSPDRRQAAEKLMSKDYLDCFSCHLFDGRQPEGKREEWAPDLARVSARIDAGWLVRWLRDPAKIVPGTKMPSFFADASSGPDDILAGDEEAQILALRDFLVSLPAEPRRRYAAVRAEYPEVVPAHGRSLAVRLNCTGCHRIEGMPEGRKVGPRLGSQGSRVRREWLEAFLRKPYAIKPEYAIMGSHARMPTFRLSDGEVRLLTEYIMTRLVDPTLVPLPADAVSPGLAAEGRQLFRAKYCDNCHRIGSRPGGIGPDLTEAWKRLNPAWTYRFVLNPSHFLDTRMPDLKLTEAEARAVTAYLMNPGGEP